jgi:hypothetical protein
MSVSVQLRNSFRPMRSDFGRATFPLASQRSKVALSIPIFLATSAVESVIAPSESHIYIALSRPLWENLVRYPEAPVMGNRDKRGREKRKPKKKEIKQTSAPARPVLVYKPAAPAQQEQTDPAPVKIP